MATRSSRARSKAFARLSELFLWFVRLVVLLVSFIVAISPLWGGKRTPHD